METLITRDIKVTVETFFQVEYSRPLADQYVFSYCITIENHGHRTVQLLERHWHILDSAGNHREVKGEGVIGKQPTLEKGQFHQYVSWCPLATMVGKMYGTYTMRYLDTDEHFIVKIPEFRLAASYILN